MLQNILLGLLSLIAVFAIYIAAQPSEFVVRREGFVAAPPNAVFAQVNDFHKWQDWSPWAKIDPNAKATFAGPAAGEGARFSWAGNREVGEGSMLITDSTPDERIRMRLDFKTPMEATNDTLFTFKPDGEGTRMTWEMRGHNNFVARIFCFIFNMDKTVGGMFEKGIANINETIKSKGSPQAPAAQTHG